jgi:nucleoside-diphosphate-sugar epimerase
MPTRILIAGAGDLGVRAGLLLHAAGAQVFALKRNPSDLPPELHPLAADLTRPETLTSLPEVDQVVYSVAADTSSDEAYQQAYVVGLSNLVQSLSVQRAPLERVLFVSSTAVYAQTDGSWVDESSLAEPDGFSGIRTLQAEALLQHAGFRHVVLRSAGIYGPGRTRLLDQVQSGKASYDPQQPEYGNRIHVDDLARAIVHLLQLSTAASLYNAVDHEPAPRQQVLQWLATSLGAPAPRAVASAAAAEPSSARRARATDKRVSGSLLRESGFQFVYPSYREGYAQLIALRS